MERFNRGSNINSSYEILEGNDMRDNAIPKPDSRKLSILITLGFISTVILMFILGLGIYVYTREHGNIQKVNNFIDAIDGNEIAKIISDTTYFMESLNMTRVHIDEVISNIQTISDTFGTIDEVTKFIIDAKYLVYKACSYMSCDTIENGSYNMSQVVRMIADTKF